MPAKPPVADVVRLAIKQTRATRTQVNICYVKATLKSGSFAMLQADVQAITDAVFTAWGGNIMPQLTTDTTLVEVDGTDLSGPTGATAIHTGSVAGGLAGTALPSNVALCVSWKESLHYRGGHPRSYMGGVSATFLADVRHVTTTFQGVMQSAANNFRTAVNSAAASTNVASWALSGVHYSLNKVAQTPPLVTTISGAAVDTRLDSQRRRLGKA
jgi:hypothetical protein